MTTEKVADAAAVVSVPSAIVSFAADALPLMQFGAAVVAIVAGVFAIIVHWKKLR
jgi:hypothetical protein